MHFVLFIFSFFFFDQTRWYDSYHPERFQHKIQYMNNVQNTYCLRIQGSKSTMEVYVENPIRQEVLRHQDLRSAKKITATDILELCCADIYYFNANIAHFKNQYFGNICQMRHGRWQSNNIAISSKLSQQLITRDLIASLKNEMHPPLQQSNKK